MKMIMSIAAIVFYMQGGVIMKNDINIYKWMKNIATVFAIASAIWLSGKITRIWSLYISSRQYFTDTEWKNLISFTTIDKLLLAILIISAIVILIAKKASKNKGGSF